jgi:hypothetical protein
MEPRETARSTLLLQKVWKHPAQPKAGILMSVFLWRGEVWLDALQL